MGENLADGDQDVLSVGSDDESQQNEQQDEAEFEANAEASMADDEEDSDEDESEGEDDDDDVPSMPLRRSQRNRRKRQIVVDFDNKAWGENETYVASDDVIHINPAVIQQSKEDLKITSSDIISTSKPKESVGAGRTQLRVPRTAGVCQQALDKVSMAAFHLPEPKLEEGERLVSDHVVMHSLGVVLAEQYSINKGIRLFGDRARESVTKELRQLHDYVTYMPVHAHES
eukprot:scaffold180856_cov40-Cyclotella_meneghiniana.AAC.2